MSKGQRIDAESIKRRIAILWAELDDAEDSTEALLAMARLNVTTHDERVVALEAILEPENGR